MDITAKTIRRMNLLPVSVVVALLVREAFDVDPLGWDCGADSGPLRSVHPPRAATDEHIVFGDVGHELSQRLDIAEVRRVLR